MKYLILTIFFGLGSHELLAQKTLDSSQSISKHQQFIKVGIFNSKMITDGGIANFLFGYEIQKNNLSFDFGLTKRIARIKEYYPDLAGFGIVSGINYENQPNSKYFTLSGNIGVQLVHEIERSLILMPNGKWLAANQHSLIFGPTFGLGISKKIYKNLYIESEVGFTGTWWLDLRPLSGFHEREGIDTGTTLRINLMYKING